jgi:hypothetical protein
LSFLLTIPGMIAAAFIAGVVLGALLHKKWKLAGWAVTALAALFAAVHHSTEWMDIFFAALWAAIGAFPGAALGGWLRRRIAPAP